MITEWAKIADQFTDTLIIGNGASVAISSSFHYPSLFSASINTGLLSQEAQAVFRVLETQDFEYVLRSLASSSKINIALGIQEVKTAEQYELIRKALIETVQSIHPKRDDIVADLTKIEEFTYGFNRLFSLNYDVILYWAIMQGNEERGRHTYKDCFMGRHFAYDEVEDLKKPFGGNAKAIVVFYPHGNLALSTNSLGEENKVKRDMGNLLDAITDAWRLGSETPLFVSEGTAEKKMGSIRRNPYLNHVFHNELREGKESVCIYGWSLAEQDDHILKALASAKPKRAAVSVYSPQSEASKDWMITTTRKLKGIGIQESMIFFFDSKEIGVWNN